MFPTFPHSLEPLPVDRGAAAVWQSLKKLQTRTSIMMVVGHGHLTANRIFTARLVDIHPDVDQRDKKLSCKGLQFVAAANRIDARENDIDVAALRSDLGPIRQPLDDVGGWIYGLNDTLCV